jgi:hypothetical protein
VACSDDRRRLGMMPTRELAVWNADHDNGWTTVVTEMIDGTFHASAAPTGSRGCLTQYIEMDEPSAKAAAAFALAEKTGHRECSKACTGWKVHTHSVHVPDRH